MATPIISWYEGTNALVNEVKNTVNFGTVDSDTSSPTKVFYVWNNRGGQTDVSKMEEVTFTTRDRQGGLGDVAGSVVEAVRDNWFNVRVDSLSETTFTPVGKGGAGAVNPRGVKDIGTTGKTTNIHASTSQLWSPNLSLAVDDYVQPTVANGFIYKVVTTGTTDGVEPTWLTTESNTQFDGTVEFMAVKIEKTPLAREILGIANNTLPDGSNASLAGGNFAVLSVYADVPITASAGRNQLAMRVSYRYV